MCCRHILNLRPKTIPLLKVGVSESARQMLNLTLRNLLSSTASTHRPLAAPPARALRRVGLSVVVLGNTLTSKPLAPPPSSPEDHAPSKIHILHFTFTQITKSNTVQPLELNSCSAGMSSSAGGFCSVCGSGTYSSSGGTCTR